MALPDLLQPIAPMRTRKLRSPNQTPTLFSCYSFVLQSFLFSLLANTLHPNQNYNLLNRSLTKKSRTDLRLSSSSIRLLHHRHLIAPPSYESRAHLFSRTVVLSGPMKIMRDLVNTSSGSVSTMKPAMQEGSGNSSSAVSAVQMAPPSGARRELPKVSGAYGSVASTLVLYAKG